MTTVFGIDPSQVRYTAGVMERDASALADRAGDIADAVPASAALPGGTTAAAVLEGARRVASAVDGEATVVDVIGTDLRSFAAVVDTAERDAARSLEGAH